jgi:polyhydroxyalkanoate synthesis regulator phasin
MASKISDFFSNADAKSRIFIVVATVVGIVGVIIVGSKMLGGGTKASGQAKLADTPSLQSVPGGQLTPEYYRALMQANSQSAQQAQISGTSAVPTLVNAPTQTASLATGNCTTVCPGDEAVNVADDINGLLRDGKLSAADASQLLALAKKNVPVSEYAAYLDDMVKQGKLTPEQARKLLESYTKQHANAAIAQSAQTMDALIKSGKLSSATANELLALQKKNVTPAEYKAELDRLVREGKISPEVAAQLLAQYIQQKAKEKTEESGTLLKQMAKMGQIAPEVADDLLNLQKKNVPVSEYEAELNRLVAAGKMTPETAAKLLAQYKAAHGEEGPATTLNNMVASAEAANIADMNDLVASGKVSPEVATQLLALQKQNVSPQYYNNAIDQLVKEGKLSPEAAQHLKDNYAKLYGLRTEAKNLNNLQANKAPVSAYKAELTRGVDKKLMTPAAAADLLQQYQTLMTPALIAPPTGASPDINSKLPGAQDFAILQQRIAAEQAARPTAAAVNAADETAQFSADVAAADAEAARVRQQHIQELMAAMSGQAQSLVAAWQSPKMEYRAGAGEEKKKASGAEGSSATQAGSTSNGKSAVPEKPPLLKAGTILFAVLTTAVDSDYPDTPVMATIVSGDFKGAILLGKLALATGQDKVSLSFTIMNREDWPKTKSVTAFAIDPDTARTVMASNVNNHYMLRYGTMFASSFVTGYANGISQSGSTSTTGIFGTSTTHPQLSPGEKLAVGLGQVGTAFGTALQSYVNTPVTVKVNSGVGLGILFMADVT